MKKYVCLALFCVFSSCVWAQFAAVVSDPTSVMQRATLFLEELDESLRDRYELVAQTKNTAAMLKNAKEGIEKLQKVSHYVQSAKISLEIVQEGAAVGKQIKTIQKDFQQLDQLTKEEQYNAVCFLIAVADEVSQKVEEGTQMVNARKNNGEMTDYERIQLLKGIHAEIKVLRRELNAVHSRFKAKNSGALLDEHLRAISREVLFFSMDKAWGTHPVPGYNPRKKSSKKSTSKTHKKS